MTAIRRAETFYAKDMRPTLTQQLIARTLFGHRVDIPVGKTRYNYDTVSNMKDAIISTSLPDGDGPWESIKVTDSEVQLAYISEKWVIPKDKMDAFESEGKSLPTAANRAAARAIGNSEEKLLMNNWKPDGSNAKLNGLYASAGNVYSTSSSFGTFGGAKTAVAGMFQKISEDKVPVSALNWNLGLNSVEFYKLEASQLNGTYEKPMIEKMINKVGGALGKIYESPELAAGTALLTPVDTAGTYIDLLVAKDPSVVLGKDSRQESLSPTYATSYELLAPLIYEPNAICTATNIA